MRINHILIDFENVQPTHLRDLEQDFYRVVIFVGENQHKVSLELAASVQRLGERAQYLQISGNGKNALDFHIAYQIGVLTESEPNTCIHIVSKDTGFDPLISYLQSQKIIASRSASIEELPPVVQYRKVCALSVPERARSYDDKFKSKQGNRPKTIKTLTNSIAGFFQQILPSPEIEKIIADLKRQKLISVKDEKITYPA